MPSVVTEIGVSNPFPEVANETLETHGMSVETTIIEVDINSAREPIRRRKTLTFESRGAQEEDIARDASRNWNVGKSAELCVLRIERERVTSLRVNNANHPILGNLPQPQRMADQGRARESWDIESFDDRGDLMYIEVKGTKLGIDEPFDISSDQMEAAEEKGTSYYIYRVTGMASTTQKIYVFCNPIEFLTRGYAERWITGYKVIIDPGSSLDG